MAWWLSVVLCIWGRSQSLECWRTSIPWHNCLPEKIVLHICYTCKKYVLYLLSQISHLNVCTEHESPLPGACSVQSTGGCLSSMG